MRTERTEIVQPLALAVPKTLHTGFFFTAVSQKKVRSDRLSSQKHELCFRQKIKLKAIKK